MGLAPAMFTNATDADFSPLDFPIRNTTCSYSINLFSAASNQLLALSSKQLHTVSIIHACRVPHLHKKKITKTQSS